MSSPLPEGSAHENTKFRRSMQWGSVAKSGVRGLCPESLMSRTYAAIAPSLSPESTTILALALLGEPDRRERVLRYSVYCGLRPLESLSWSKEIPGRRPRLLQVSLTPHFATRSPRPSAEEFSCPTSTNKLASTCCMDIFLPQAVGENLRRKDAASHQDVRVSNS